MFKSNSEIIRIEAQSMNEINTGVVFWSHDRGTAKLIFKLVKNNLPQSLPEGTTVPIRLTFSSSTAEGGIGKHDYLATIDDRINGLVSIVLQDNILGYQGRVNGSIYIDLPNGRSLDTAGRFIFDIKRSPIDDSTPELEDYYFNGFSQTIDKIEKIVAQTKSEIDQAANDVTKKINAANTSLKELNESVEVLEGNIKEGEQHFVTKSSTEKGLMIYRSQFVTAENWNDIQDSGIYYCAGATGENMPIKGTLYGYLIVIKSAGIVIQQFLSNGVFFMRAMIGNPMTWNPWTKFPTDGAVVHVSGNESIDGFKNFLQTPTVKGKEILIDEELPYEAWFSGSEELKNIPNKARLRIGPEVMNVGQKLGRKMRSSPLVWNSGRWQAEIKRDCKLLVEGLARLQFGASSSGKYGYLVFYNDDAQKKSIGFVGGTGDAVNTLQWKHGLHFGRIFEAKAGTVFNITYEGEEGKKVDFAQINTLHIMEII